MMLHEGFLCATEEHVDIEVINPLITDRTILHFLLQWNSQEQPLSAITATLSLEIESSGTVGIALIQAPASMLLHGRVYYPPAEWT